MQRESQAIQNKTKFLDRIQENRQEVTMNEQKLLDLQALEQEIKENIMKNQMLEQELLRGNMSGSIISSSMQSH